VRSQVVIASFTCRMRRRGRLTYTMLGLIVGRLPVHEIPTHGGSVIRSLIRIAIRNQRRFQAAPRIATRCLKALQWPNATPCIAHETGVHA
jgi:hypothetical protein